MRKTVRTLWLCSNCGSDRVQQKAWVSLNDNSIDWDGASDLCDDEDYYCQDCGEHLVPITQDVPVKKKVIGFQVVNDNQDIHPLMEGSFCLYSLSQAKEMLEDAPGKNLFNEWKLLAIWTGDVEEPTKMFTGNPRQ